MSFSQGLEVLSEALGNNEVSATELTINQTLLYLDTPVFIDTSGSVLVPIILHDAHAHSLIKFGEFV